MGTAPPIRAGIGDQKLYLLPTFKGMPVAWRLADPKLGERDVAADLLGHARGQVG